MIRGAATAKGTVTLSKKHDSHQFQPLGRTNWQVSQAGFGCYRVSAGIDSHFEALLRALSNGINVIDTSTNYTDGGSEQLVGKVMAHAISDGRITRDQVVVVSKVGYLQGRNFALSQKRKQQGKPFPDLVPYGKGLEHCIHPQFIEDQLSRSLSRLGLGTLDLLLLHNPEYYLGWVAKRGEDLENARDIFYHRIRMAFEYLEKEVARGRIQAYGISANTFPARLHDAEFVSLERVWDLALEISSNHHFRVIQLPMNLYENGAVLTENQNSGQSVLSFAKEKQLGVLINRPLNAFSANRLVRLADVENIGEHTDSDIIQSISLLNKSEKVLWRKVLPKLNLPAPLYGRIKDQIAVGDQLKHHWRNFGSYERWRQFKDGLLWPHVQGVFDFLKPHAAQSEAIDKWLVFHRERLDSAVRAVGSLYVEKAKREIAAIVKTVKASDPDWDVEGTLSQLAVRAVRSTSGVHCVLIGMRQCRYVDDILKELARPVRVGEHTDAWKNLSSSLTM